MKNIQTSVVVEENWVEAHTSKLQSLPTATSALELDVSTHFSMFLTHFHPFLLQNIIALHISLCCCPNFACVLWSHCPCFYSPLNTLLRLLYVLYLLPPTESFRISLRWFDI